jgi:asparaginyl-tRNA synthetase
MQKYRIAAIHDGLASETQVQVTGWLTSKRRLGQVLFLTLADATGVLHVVLECTRITKEVLRAVAGLPVESVLTVTGAVRTVPRPHGIEVHADTVEVVSRATKRFSPKLRADIDIFDERHADHLLRNRHLYLRNGRVQAILRFRHEMMGAVHQWFREREFLEITAPLLTTLPLYDGPTAIPVTVGDQDAYLTQCVGFYLEAAAHAFDRVYSIGPSFRGEESKSKRHLMEYWHVKAEVMFTDREGLMTSVESLISDLTRHAVERCGPLAEVVGLGMRTEGLRTPYPRLTYREAVAILQAEGSDIVFGQSLGSTEETALARQFDTPFWVVGNPRAVEPFPYSVDPADAELTMTADLIATAGFGELLGVAEKITTLPELDERMAEKGKAGDTRYDWVRELREAGCPPHGGFGMGVERFLRWLLGIPHVRDTIPFPRTFRRKIYP